MCDNVKHCCLFAELKDVQIRAPYQDTLPMPGPYQMKTLLFQHPLCPQALAGKVRA